jgi:hypothetical protein
MIAKIKIMILEIPIKNDLNRVKDRRPKKKGEGAKAK